MKIIGIVTNGLEITQEMKQLFVRNDIYLKEIALESLQEVTSYNRFDGILIEEREQDSVSQICERFLELKGRTNAFIWILTKGSTSINRQVYLQLGVDGNFDIESFPEELNAYLGNFFRRHEQLKSNYREIYKIVEHKTSDIQIQLNPSVHSLVVSKGDIHREVRLTKTEYRILELLYNQIGTAVSYDVIYNHVWKENYVERPFRIANIISRIREKLEQESINHTFLKTVHSKGYMIKI